MSELVSDLKDTSADGDVLRQKAVAAKEAVVDLASESKRFAAQRISHAKDAAVDLVRGAKSKAGAYVDDVSGYIQRNPMKSVAIAAGVGIVAGMLLKRRR